MLPEAKSEDLLYIAVFTRPGQHPATEVLVYSYASHQLVGTLKGFKDPQTLCADTAGNVYINDQEANAIVVYAHGASKPKAKLPDSAIPYSCSVDPSDGNLAVANDDNSIFVYQKARGTPKQYDNTRNFWGVSCAYGNSDILFVQDTLTKGNYTYKYFPKYGELVKGRKQLRWLRTRKVFDEIGIQVLWDGAYLVASQSFGLIRYAVVGRAITVHDTIPLDGEPDEFWLVPKYHQVVAVYDPFVEYFNYPEGGRRVSMFTVLDGDTTTGMAVSLASSR